MPQNGATKFWTKALTAELVLTEDDNVTYLSLKVVSGTCTFQGTRQFKGMDSEAITLSEGDVLNLDTHGQNDSITGTLTPVGGTTNVIIKF